MSGWILAAIALVVGGLLPCLVVCARAPAMEGLVALELAGVISTLVLLLLAEGLGRPPFADLALVLGLLSFVGALVFVRFVEREL